MPSIQTPTVQAQAAIARMVTFPNRVTTTETTEPPADEIQALEDLFKAEGLDMDALADEGIQTKSLNANGSLSLAQFLLQWPSRPQAYQVKIPETGQFKLLLQVGDRYQVLDNDATDGSATIQLPSGTLDTWLHLNQHRDANSQLVIEDPLYYVKDTLTLQQKGWLKLGLRPLPVPADWHSESAGDLVLNFDAKQLSGFEMVWQRKPQKQAAFPPGIQKIGPEGGVIELPGIAKLEIPAGALASPILIRLSQVLTVPDVSLYCIDYKSLYECKQGDEYITPVLKIEPLRLSFSNSALLDLFVPESYRSWSDMLGPLFSIFLAKDKLDDPGDFISGSFRSISALYQPFPIKKTGFYGKLVHKGFKLNQQPNQPELPEKKRKHENRGLPIK